MPQGTGVICNYKQRNTKYSTYFQKWEELMDQNDQRRRRCKFNPVVLGQLERSGLPHFYQHFVTVTCSLMQSGEDRDMAGLHTCIFSLEDCIDFSVDVIFVSAASPTGRNLAVCQTIWLSRKRSFMAAKWPNSSHKYWVVLKSPQILHLHKQLFLGVIIFKITVVLLECDVQDLLCFSVLMVPPTVARCYSQLRSCLILFDIPAMEVLMVSMCGNVKGISWKCFADAHVTIF